MPERLDVPNWLRHRNAPSVLAHGLEFTGAALIDYATSCLGVKDLHDTDVLDIGCGVRFAQTLINRQIPIKSYTGIDVDRRAIDFLAGAIDDDRFTFAYWDIQNPLYNPGGAGKLMPTTPLPVSGTFDAIWMFSVVTHMDPADTDAVLAILRRHVRPHGMLLFSASLDEGMATYRERDPSRPSAQTFYNPGFLSNIVSHNGWEACEIRRRGSMRFIVDHYLCKPAPE